MTRRSRLIALPVAIVAIALLVTAGLLNGFVPRFIQLPEYLYGTPVEEDVRREIRRSLRPIFLRAADTERTRGTLLFPAAPAGKDDTGDSSPVRLVPTETGTGAVEEAIHWLRGEGRGPVVLAYSPSAFPGYSALEEMNRDDSIRSLRLDRAGETDASVQRILAAIDGDASRSGLILLAGEHTPAITAALLSGARSAGLLVVPELFLRSAGTRMRTLGIPVAGVLAPDLADTLRNLPIRLERVDDIYVPVTFFRY